MPGLWFWIGVAGSGALHGLHPASGWMFAIRRGNADGAAWKCLAPLALGHLAALAAVAVAGPMPRLPGVPLATGALAAGALYLILVRSAGSPRPIRILAGACCLALWPLAVAGLLGAGALPLAMPWCAGTTGGASAIALGALALHAGAMLACAALASRLAGCGLNLLSERRKAGCGRTILSMGKHEPKPETRPPQGQP